MNSKFIPVTSSNIEGYFYTQSTSILLITFKSGATYRYDAVPSKVVSDFAAAPSKGTFFGKSIRDVYTTTKLEPDEVDALVGKPAPRPAGPKKPSVSWLQLVEANPWLRNAF